MINFERTRNSWMDFWFAPRSTLPVAVFRILLGLLVMWSQYLKLPNYLEFYGRYAIVSLDTVRDMAGYPALALFKYLPQTDSAVWLFYSIMLLAGLFLALGFWTRTATIVLWIGLLSELQRNPFILNSADVLMRIMVFFMIFAPSAERLSVDRLLKRQVKGTQLDPDPKKSLWAWRLLQLQVVAVYLQAFWSKAGSAVWIDGTAVYYILHLREFTRFPLLFVQADDLWFSKLASWFALVTEFSMFTLIWIRKFRYYVLLAGLLLHLGIEWMLNVPIFEWLMIATFVLFVDAEDLQRVLNGLLLFRAPSSSPAQADSGSCNP